MMSDLIRETALGQIIRFLSRRRLLPYPEERPGFQIPYLVPQEPGNGIQGTTRRSSDVTQQFDLEKSEEKGHGSSLGSDLDAPSSKYTIVDWYTAGRNL
jgi:DHA1 family multidrug resistance protein-like MFS transporter